MEKNKNKNLFLEITNFINKHNLITNFTPYLYNKFVKNNLTTNFTPSTTPSPTTNTSCDAQNEPKKCSIILGLSGGPDSVFLLHILSQLKDAGKIDNIIATHLDHEWRPESAKEAIFCQEIAKKYGVTCITKKLSELKNLGFDHKFDGSKEELGRKARRFLFEFFKKEYNCDSIALAHHAQDQEETFFIRLIRGASLSGLVSIKPKSGYYIRPILEINKRDILEFLDKNKIQYVTDQSNTSHDYLRNRIRELVIPELKKCDTRFEQNFKNTITRLSETEDFLQELTKETFNKITDNNPEKTNTPIRLNLNQFFNLHKILQYRILIYWLIKEDLKFPTSQSFFDEVIKFLKQPESKTHKIHHNWSIIKKKNIAYLQSQE